MKFDANARRCSTILLSMCLILPIAAIAQSPVADGEVNRLIRDLDDFGKSGPAIKRLVEIGEPAVSELLAAHLDAQSGMQKTFSRDALIDIGAAAVPTLQAALNGIETNKKSGVLAILGSIGEPAVPALAGLAASKDSADRMQAARALGRVESRGSVEVLRKLLEDENAGVKHAAVDSLGKLDVPLARSALIEALRDPDLTSAAAAAFSKSKNFDAFAPLVDALQVVPINKGYSIILALNRIGKEHVAQAEPVLLSCLDAEVDELRAGCAEVLVELSGESYSRRLESALTTRDIAVVGGARRYFISLHDAAANELLVEAMLEFENLRWAEDLMMSGNSKLERAAWDWATRELESREAVDKAFQCGIFADLAGSRERSLAALDWSSDQRARIDLVERVRSQQSREGRGTQGRVLDAQLALRQASSNAQGISRLLDRVEARHLSLHGVAASSSNELAPTAERMFQDEGCESALADLGL